MRRALPRLAVFLVTLLSLSSCGGDGGSGPSSNAVASVAVSPSSASLTSVGATQQLSASAKNSGGSTVSGTTFTWSSSNTGVATVSAAGVVTAVADGTTSVRASADGTSVSGSAQVTVAQAATTVVVTPETGALDVGQTLQLSASATDAMGAAIASPTLVWSSSNDGIATVSGAGLVTGAGAGSATITATSGSASDGAGIDVTFPDLVITGDMDLSGEIDADQVLIPAGVTVTATDDLDIRATGLVEILGDIIGDCVEVEIQGDTAVTVNGTIDNGCAAGQEPERLKVGADGELTLEDATLISSGEIELTNDPTLTDDDFPESGPSAAAPLRAGKGVPFTRVNRSTVRYAGGETGPDPAKPGADGVDGGKGDDGRPVRFRLRGNAIFAGNTLLWGQDGGAGGNGTASAANDVAATGGNGGVGGTIRLFVTGSLTYEGGENIVRTGSGGKGGNATATALPNDAGNQAPSGDATGGDGAGPGLLNIRAGGGIRVNAAGALVLEVGKPGDGGDATATGADGRDALGATVPAQVGGDADADGGDGADTPDKQLVKQNNVTGSPPVLRAAGGGQLDGGMGGVAKATAGKGGNGIQTNKPGAMGGSPGSFGGGGGDALTKGLTGNFVGNGGPGGLAHFLRALGGNGWSDCAVGQPVESGGAGGAGGEVGGEEGFGGTQGLAPGADGGTKFEEVANGGDGGNGQAPGAFGPRGTDNVLPAVNREDVPKTFEDGKPGNPCPPGTVEEEFFIHVPSIPNNLGVVQPGFPANPLIDIEGTTRGSLIFGPSGPPGTAFLAPNPDRIGWAAPFGWLFDLTSFQVTGWIETELMEMHLCAINSSAGIGNEIKITQRDGEGQTVQVDMITQNFTPAPPLEGSFDPPGCPMVQINPQATEMQINGLLSGGADVRGPPGSLPPGAGPMFHGRGRPSGG